jgi:hypothetical protein
MCFCILGCGKPSTDSISVPVEIGEHVNFGSYQGEEIEWRVLDVKDGNVLLFSEYGLDVKSYNETSASDISWEDCTLRQWLNNDFYDAAFSDEEKEQIILSTSEGFSKYNSRVPGEKYDHLERETEDNVFLLSYTEICEYIANTDESGTDPARFCYPTEYAKSNPDLDIYNDVCGWWMCAGNLGYNDRHRPGVVTNTGGINLDVDAASMKYAVRPAIWIQWEENENDSSIAYFSEEGFSNDQIKRFMKSEDIFEVGNNVVISKDEIQQCKEYYLNLGMEDDEAQRQAQKNTEERYALYVAAIKNGYSVTDEDVYNWLDELREMLENNDSGVYEDALAGFESEDAYWDYEFDVYCIDLPIQNYVKELQKDFSSSNQLDNNNEESNTVWYDYFEQIKEDMVKEQNFQAVNVE